jgi:hypothetical protein
MREIVSVKLEVGSYQRIDRTVKLLRFRYLQNGVRHMLGSDVHMY